MLDCDILVIGAGIVGVCCAHELSDRGKQVLVVDKQGICESTSFGNAGVVSPWACSPISLPGMWKNVPKWLLDNEAPLFIRWQYMLKFMPWGIRFLRESRHDKVSRNADGMLALSRGSAGCYRKLLEGTGKENLLKESNYVYAYRDANKTDLDKLEWQLRRDRNIPIERVDGRELSILEPNLSSEFKAAVVIRGQGRTTNPSALGKAIAAKAAAKGVKFLHQHIDGLQQKENGWEVRLSSGVLVQTKQVLLSAGVWSQGILRDLGVFVPLEAERGYHLFLHDAGLEINNSVMDGERYCVASSMDGGVRIAGTAEFAGVDASPDFRRARTFMKVIKGMFPSIDTSRNEEWMGRRPSTPDSLPCLGAVEGHKGLYVAFGHAHYGLSMAPETARVLANCMMGLPNEISLAPYKVERF